MRIYPKHLYRVSVFSTTHKILTTIHDTGFECMAQIHARIKYQVNNNRANSVHIVDITTEADDWYRFTDRKLILDR